MILSRDQILALRLPTERVPVQGGEVIVRALPQHVVARVQSLNLAQKNGEAYAFVNAVVDESGKRLYSDDDAALIEELDVGFIQMVVSTAFRLTQPSAEQLLQIKKNWTTLGGAASGE